MKIKFYGTRGSVPVPQKNHMKVGGDTSCVLVIFEDNNLMI